MAMAARNGPVGPGFECDEHIAAPAFDPAHPAGWRPAVFNLRDDVAAWQIAQEGPDQPGGLVDLVETDSDPGCHIAPIIADHLHLNLVVWRVRVIDAHIDFLAACPPNQPAHTEVLHHLRGEKTCACEAILQTRLI